MYNDVRFTLNGKPVVYTGNPLRRLLDVLREDYGLTGSKEGCGEGECGTSSTVQVPQAPSEQPSLTECRCSTSRR